jgi:hypothetical protein
LEVFRGGVSSVAYDYDIELPDDYRLRESKFSYAVGDFLDLLFAVSLVVDLVWLEVCRVCVFYFVHNLSEKC